MQKKEKIGWSSLTNVEKSLPVHEAKEHFLWQSIHHGKILFLPLYRITLAKACSTLKEFLTG